MLWTFLRKLVCLFWFPMSMRAAKRSAFSAPGMALQLEILEDRCLLAPLMVGKNFDISRKLGNEAESAIASNPQKPDQLFAIAIPFPVGGINGPGLFAAISQTPGVWAPTPPGGFAGLDSLPRGDADPQAVFDPSGNLFVTYLTSTQGVQFGTASGSTATTLQDSGRKWSDRIWIGLYVQITDGDGKGQIRKIVGNTIDTLTVDRAWDAGKPPGAKSKYLITRAIVDDLLYPPGISSGDNTATTLTDTKASFPEKGFDKGARWYVSITGGPGAGQIREITTTSEKTLTVSLPWTILPQKGSKYQLLYASVSSVAVLLSDDGGKTFKTLKLLGLDGEHSDYPTIAVGPGGGTSKYSVWVSWQDFKGIYAAGAPVKGLGDVGDFGSVQQLYASTAGSPHVDIGPNGQVLVAYKTVAKGVATIRIAGDLDGLGKAGFTSSTTLPDKLFDKRSIPAQPVRRVTIQPKLAWDRSGLFAPKGTNGRVYLVYENAASPTSEDFDIYLRSSDDNGKPDSWSAPKKVNQASIKSQFMPSVAVDQTTGYVAVVWYDARNSPGTSNDKVQVFGTVSRDGGKTFLPSVKIGDQLSSSVAAAKAQPGYKFDFGEYLGLAYQGGAFYTTWSDNSNSAGGNPNGANKQFDLYSSKVTVQKVGQVNATEGIVLNAVPLGTFTDTGAGPYSATVNWGDGTSSPATITPVPGTSDDNVTASHTWLEDGTYTISTTVSSALGSLPLPPVPASVADATLTETPVTLSGTKGTALPSNTTLATFTDANAGSSAADFTALVNWGDGSQSNAIITGSGGNFTVQGGHTYLNSGTDSVTVPVLDAGGSNAFVIDTATITGPVTLQALPVSATDGISTGTVPVASFTATVSGPFTAFIDWGDGHRSTGTVTFSGGVYSVSGSNTYGTAGSFPLTVTIADSLNNVLAVVNSGITVADAPLSAIGSDIHATQGIALNNVVLARFTDSNPNDSPAQYSNTIDWGDSNPSGNEDTPPDTGTIVAEGNGTFAVLGSHTYLTSGNFTPTVSLSDNEGSSATANPTVTVAAAMPTVTGVGPFFGPPQGGNPVTLSGIALFGATAVTFGTTPATAFTINPDGTITAIAPALTAGTAVDVTVTTALGTSSTSAADQYSAVAAAPTVTALSSSSGPTGGGSSLTVTGTNLAATTAVSFGTTAATFTVISNTSLSVTVPAQASGTVDLVVTNPYGVSATSAADRYTYTATAPTVTGLSAATGPAAGGSLLQISGTNFNGATQVSFGGTVVTSFTVQDSTSILLNTPALGAGTVHVQVTSPYGTSGTSSADQYTAVTAPAVTSLSATSGPTGGGGTVTLTGSGFTNATQVLFGTTPAAYTVNSDTSVTATVPPASAGVVTVSVSSDGGASAAGSGNSYTYNATAPTVTAVSPNAGPLAGGTSITLTGTNLNGATAVAFGATAALDFTVVSATQITATAPAGTSGVSDIRVTTPYGTSATSSADQFTYADAAAPAVTAVSVTGTTFPSGPMAGGTTVVLTGSGFSNATQVQFGDAVATSFTINSDTQLTATAPAHAAATLSVSVVTPYGTSAPAAAAVYTYLAAVPSITSLSLSSGSTAGGDSVTISGANFLGATDVRFGSVPAASFVVNGDSSLTATTPAAAVGTVDVRVLGPAGVSTTGAADQFTFGAATGLATVSSLGTSTGPTGGGTTVTVIGTGFTTATVVAFGATAATSFQVTSDTSLTAVTPVGAGTVSVRVTNASGVSAPGGSFTYQSTAPSVSGLSLATGPASGGTSVTLTGANLNGATAVTFGTTAATSFTINSPTSITAVAPAQAAATIQVTVTTPNGTSATSAASQFQYVSAAAPTVASVTPAFGPMAGGTSVALTGTGFTGATRVLFGSVAATAVNVLDDGDLTATAPSQASGSVDITVVTPAGVSAATPADAFAYTAIGPAVSSLGTTAGPTAGGTVVILNGSNLTGTTAVLFGSTAATFFQVLSDAQVRAISPLAAAGAVQLSVVTANGTSSTGAGTTFTYSVDPSATPTVTGLSASSGPSSGGTALTLTGTNLAGTTQVLFGQAPAAFTLVSSTALSVTAPPGTVGVVDVTVLTPLGLSATGAADQFTYQSAVPTVTGLSPSTDTTAGGTVIAITGTNFATVTGVTFGGIPASQFTVLSNTSITAVDPVQSAGSATVQVTNPDGTATGAAFTYTSTSSTPAVTSLSATSGPTGGGNQVTLTGTNFSNVTGVFFGATPASTYTVNSATSITATVPFAAAGAVTVSVATAAGLSAAGSGTTYTYNATAPTVTGLSPASGPTAGGASVVITGTNLNGATAVTFAGTAATSYSIDSATQITAVAPAGIAGSAQVTVTTPYGTSSTSGSSQFTYVAVPTVTGLDVNSGSTAGGTSVTITGANFTGLVSVAFAGLSASSLTVNSATSITATTPAEGPGVADVIVTTSSGASPVVDADQFTFNAPVPSVTGVSPSGSALAGGSSVTITGSGFSNTAAVSFGSSSAAFTVNSDTQITATVPAATAAATVDIQVSGQYGILSATGTADQFTYYGVPTITSLSQSSDTATGGASVIINGTNLNGATAVSFGGTSATFTVNSPTSITAVAPAHASGSANLTVTSPGGTSTAAAFTYTTANAVSWVGPSSGDWATASNWSSAVLPGPGDDVTIGSGVTVTHSSGSDSVHSLTVSGSLVLSGGSLAVAATSSVSNLTLSGGTLSGTGTLNITSFTWSGGTQSGTGVTALGGSSTLDSSTLALILSGRTVTNSGSLTWNGTNALQLNSGAAWNNLSQSTFQVHNDATVTAAVGTGTFANAGTFTKSGGTGTTTFTSLVAFNNTGSVNIQTGTLSLAAGSNSGGILLSSGATLNFAGSYTLTTGSAIGDSGAVVFSGGTTTVAGSITASTITIQSGAAITGAATLSGMVTNSGTIHVGGAGVAGTLTIMGNFTQTSTGVLNVEIGGTSAGSQFDQLVISGMATLGGTLNVTLLNGFVPATGNTFPVLTFSSSSGSFATTTGLTQAGIQFTPQSNSTNFTLVVMSSRATEGEDGLPLYESDPVGPRRAEGEAVVSAPVQEEILDAPAAWPWVLLPASNPAESWPEDVVFLERSNAPALGDEEMLAALAARGESLPGGLQDLVDLLASLLEAVFEVI